MLFFDQVKTSLRGRAPTRMRRPEAAWAAVAVILAPPEDAAVLMIRRAERAGDRWSGHIGLPGGRRDPEDRDLLATALRETREETGIELGPGDLLGELDDLGPRAVGAPAILVRPFVFGLALRPPVAPSEEVADHFWFPLAGLRARGAGVEVAVPDVPRKVRAYLLDAHVVWGLTHRILAQLVDRLTV